MNKFDVIIIGAGPGGYTAALRLSKALKVAIVDKREDLGGTCLNIGCIPSKALLEASQHVLFLKQKASSFGIEATYSIDFDKMMQRKEQIVDKLVKGLDGLFEMSKITRLCGTAHFIEPHAIEVNGERLEADRFIIATGGETVSLPFLPIDEKRVLSSTGALSLKAVPKTLLVVGAGVIGVELASVYSRLGAEVTVVEMLDRVCPMLDSDLSKGLQQVLEAQGIKFHLNAKLKSDRHFVQDDKEHAFEAEKILVAVGRRPFTADLGLEGIGVVLTKGGFIAVDECLRTSLSHIFAIGDVVKGPQLAHRASEEGFQLAEFLLGLEAEVNPLAIPNVIYTHPEVASVGLTREEAPNGRSASFPLKANGRALCEGEDEGFVKVVYDKESRRLLGLHILAPHAGEMIGEGVVAILKRMRVDELARAPHAHPTLSEAIKDAALKTS